MCSIRCGCYCRCPCCGCSGCCGCCGRYAGEARSAPSGTADFRGATSRARSILPWDRLHGVPCRACVYREPYVRYQLYYFQNCKLAQTSHDSTTGLGARDGRVSPTLACWTDLPTPRATRAACRRRAALSRVRSDRACGRRLCAPLANAVPATPRLVLLLRLRTTHAHTRTWTHAGPMLSETGRAGGAAFNAGVHAASPQAGRCCLHTCPGAPRRSLH